jgi:hypothetical protein
MVNFLSTIDLISQWPLVGETETTGGAGAKK